MTACLDSTVHDVRGKLTLPIPWCEIFQNVRNVGVENKLQHLVIVTDMLKTDMSRHVVTQWQEI